MHPQAINKKRLAGVCLSDPQGRTERQFGDPGAGEVGDVMSRGMSEEGKGECGIQVRRLGLALLQGPSGRPRWGD